MERKVHEYINEIEKTKMIQVLNRLIIIIFHELYN